MLSGRGVDPTSLLRRGGGVVRAIQCNLHRLPFIAGVISTWGLGPAMTARGRSIGVSIGMLPQTLIMSRLDRLSRLGARI